jgi:hypothetical protein
MVYEIVVSQGNVHLFATAKRSLIDQDRALWLLSVFEQKFPKAEGYRCDLYRINTTSEYIDVDGEATGGPDEHTDD